MDSSQTTAF
uniref:Uncharacterized protein n=1 Tax=Arundo donax TaxID=35708 RepID=A0A0A8YR20_ARUDO